MTSEACTIKMALKSTRAYLDDLFGKSAIEFVGPDIKKDMPDRSNRHT